MRTHVSFLLTGLLLLLTACGEGTADDPATDEVATWTLEEDLRIDEEQDYYLGRAADVAVRADGALLVADPEEYHVKVISPAGELLRTIGRQGEGPGEFSVPRRLALARGDSLYVLDGQSVSVFAPGSYAPARTIQFPGGPEGRRFPGELMVPPAKGFLASYTVLPALGGGDPILRRITEDGEPSGTVDIPQKGQERIRTEAKKTVMQMDLPFDRRSVVALGPEGRLYHGVTDSLAVTVSDLSGQVLDHWCLPTDPRPMTDDDLRAFEEDYADEAVMFFGESVRTATREALREELGKTDLPDTKPAFYDLLIDNRQRVWIRRDPEHVETATWWVASADGEFLAELTLPGHVQLDAVRSGYAYGTLGGEGALPTVIRYRIDEAL